MKKLVTWILALTMTFSLCACGGEKAASSEAASAAPAAASAAASEQEETLSVTETEEDSAEKIPEDANVAGTYIEKTTGIRLILEADGSAMADTQIDRFAHGNSGDWHDQYFDYSVTGNTATMSCDGIPDEDFNVEQSDDGCHLVSEHCTFVPEEEFYQFEDAEIHTVGDTVEIGDVAYTLENAEFTESINPNELWDSTWVDIYSEKETYVAPDGMIYAKLTFNLSNNSKQAIEPEDVLSPVLVYDDGFVFKSFETANNYIVSGQMDYCLTSGSSSSTKSGSLTIPALNSHEITTYVLVSSAVAENSDAPLHLVLRLPDGDSSAVAIFDLRGGEAVSTSGESLYGTWAVTSVDTSSNSMTVEEMDGKGLHSWCDWKLIVADDGNLVFQTNNSTSEATATVDDSSVTAGNMVWNLIGEQLVCKTTTSTIYYDKVSDDQTFPSPSKSEIVEILKAGTWKTDAGDGEITFSDDTIYIANSENSFESSMSIDMEKGQIYGLQTVEDKVFNITFDYTYDNGTLALYQKGNELAKE